MTQIDMTTFVLKIGSYEFRTVDVDDKGRQKLVVSCNKCDTLIKAKPPEAENKSRKHAARHDATADRRRNREAFKKLGMSTRKPLEGQLSLLGDDR